MSNPSGSSAPVSSHRRSFLINVGRAGNAAAYLLRSVVPTILAPSAALLGADRAAAQSHEPLAQPSEIRSENGILRTTLSAVPGPVRLGDLAFPGLLYNGLYEPPLLRARLGDTLRITLRNDLPDQPTNLHYHGRSVSPQGNSDNVFVHVHPGHTADHEDKGMMGVVEVVA